jgi:hypothetical protein
VHKRRGLQDVPRALRGEADQPLVAAARGTESPAPDLGRLSLPGPRPAETRNVG